MTTETSVPLAHTCINTVNPMYGPPPCEACAAMPRCPHGWRLVVDKCDSCALAEATKRVALLESAIEDANDVLFDTYERDVEHIIESHSDGLREVLRRVNGGAARAFARLQEIVAEKVGG